MVPAPLGSHTNNGFDTISAKHMPVKIFHYHQKQKPIAHMCDDRMYMCDDIGLAKNTTKPRFNNAKCKFNHELIPKAVKMKRIPTWKQHEGNESLKKCRANEAWWWILRICDVIAHMTYLTDLTNATKFSYYFVGFLSFSTNQRIRKQINRRLASF